MSQLPYFDLLFEGRKHSAPAARVFERFVHWGYWEDPKLSDKSVPDLVRAMDRLNDVLLDAALLKDGQAVLDAGCGFGGTLAAIDERFSKMTLAGVNIDPRQLEVAKEQVKHRPVNHLEFFEADACALEFPDQSFDRILAVECVFHFPSRAGFLKQAARLLKKGGRLVLSDFVPKRIGGPRWLGQDWVERQIAAGFGRNRGWDEGDYAAMAEAAGLRVLIDKDITKNTLPTYPALLRALRRTPGARAMLRPVRLVRWASLLGLVKYRVLAFGKA